MALRVPKAELPAELRENMIRQLGAIPEPVEVTYNNPAVAMSSQEFSARVATWDAADTSLKTFAHMAVAAQVGCSWCLDVNYFLAQNHNLDLTKASQVPRWRESDVFTPLERDVMEYAEDVLQESWLRWADVDRPRVRDPRAYLVRTVTRQALNRLRTLSRSREDYVGEWLPEPLLTSPDVAEDVELAESVSIAMLTVLETLAPTERAVFVLREVFDMPYGEIAAAVGKSAAAVRQMAWRARDHVAARRPRMRVSRAEHQAVVERFLAPPRAGSRSPASRPR